MVSLKKPRSMHRMLTVAVGIGLLIFGTIFFLVFNTIIPIMMEQAETKYLYEQVTLVSGLLRTEEATAFRLTRDFSIWDETALFALGENDDFIESNWSDMSPTEAYGFNFLVIKDLHSRTLYAEFFDFNTGESYEPPEGFTDYLTVISNFVIAKNEQEIADPSERGVGGVFFSRGIPYLSATMPVTMSDASSETFGTATFGTILSSDYFKKLTMYERAEFHFIRTQQDKDEYLETTANSVFSLILLEDIWGDPISLAIVDSRKIYTEGMSIANTAMLVLAAIILAFALALFAIFRRIIFNPMTALIRDVDGVSAGGELNAREYSRTEELLSLSDSINDMLERLDSAQVSEDSLRHILNGLDTFLYVSDANTDELLFVNGRLVERFGIDPDSLGKKCWEVFRPGSTGHCEDCALKHILANPGSTYTWESRNHMDGRHYRHTDSFIEWPGTRNAHLLGMIDITDSVEAEAQLQRQLELQKLMSDVSSSFISEDEIEELLSQALGRVGKFMGIGNAVIATVTAEETQLNIHSNWQNAPDSFEPLQPTSMPFVPGNIFYDALVVNEAAYFDSNEAQNISQSEYMSKFVNGSFLGFLIKKSDGEIWGILVLENRASIHSWSDSDKQLAALFASLISGVVSRDAARHRLIEAKELAEESSRAKGDFLARMSHEMRTPMNAIIGMTNISRQSDDPERKEYCLEKISEASTHLLGVINDILDMSKIEASKFELSYSETNLKQILHRVVDVLNFRVEEKSQNLLVTIDPQLPSRIISDEQLLSQVITNLMSNAVKFTPNNGTISLSATFLGEENGICSIQIDVSDTGIGISKEQMERLFRPFEQADGGISRRFGGTGLGLVISKSIIDLMDGKMWVNSKLGEGSTFSFRISVECLPDSSEEAVADEPSQTGNPNGTPSFPGKRILLAEDVEINREIVLALLEPIGLTIDCAEDGVKAVEMFLHAPELYDMIFMDIHMPDMDGYEATRIIRACGLPHSVEIPIVAMTANVFREDIEKCLASGMHDHIGKPLDLQELYDKLFKYLSD